MEIANKTPWIAYLRFGASSVFTRELQLDSIRKFLASMPIKHLNEILEDDEDLVGRVAQHDLMERIQTKSIGAVVVYSLDRLDTVLGTLEDLTKFFALLEEHHVRLVSAHEGIDTCVFSSKPFSRILSAYEAAKKNIRRERVKRGLISTVIKGKAIGRPKKRDDKAIISLRNEGLSIREIAKKLGLSNSSVAAAINA